MSYPELWKRAGFAAKVEATAGTPETLSLSANGIRLIGATVPREGYLAPNTREDAITGTLGTPPPAIPAGRYFEFDLRFPLTGAGAAYAYTNETTNTLPECHPLLRASGFSLTVAGGAGSESATYVLSDDPVTTITAQLEVAGKKYLLTYGVAKSFSLAFPAGSYPVVTMTLCGIMSALTEQALEAHTYDTFAAAPWPIIKSSALSVGGYAAIFQNATVDYNLMAEANLNGNATDGHGGYRIGSYNPVMTLSARNVALSTWDPKADLLARTQRTVSLLAGNVLYKRVNLTADAAYVIDAQVEVSGIFMNYSVTYQLTPNAVMGNLVFY